MSLRCTFVSLERGCRGRLQGQTIARDEEAKDATEDGERRIPDDHRASAAADDRAEGEVHEETPNGDVTPGLGS